MASRQPPAFREQGRSPAALLFVPASGMLHFRCPEPADSRGIVAGHGLAREPGGEIELDETSARALTRIKMTATTG
jgi:hypothetical protein